MNIFVKIIIAIVVFAVLWALAGLITLTIGAMLVSKLIKVVLVLYAIYWVVKLLP